MDTRRNLWIDGNDQVKVPKFKYHNGILQFRGTTYVPKEQGLRQTILGEAHQAKYMVHPVRIK